MLQKFLILSLLVHHITSLYIPGTAQVLYNINKARLNYALAANRPLGMTNKFARLNFNNNGLHYPKIRSAEDGEDGEGQMEDPGNMGGPPEFEGADEMPQVDFLDNEEPVENLPVFEAENNMEENNQFAPRGMTNENGPVMEIPQGQEMRPLEQGEILQMTEDDKNRREREAQEFLNNYWAVNGWNNPITENYVRHINSRRAPESDQVDFEERGADPHFSSQSHHHGHNKGFVKTTSFHGHVVPQHQIHQGYINSGNDHHATGGLVHGYSEGLQHGGGLVHSGGYGHKGGLVHTGGYNHNGLGHGAGGGFHEKGFGVSEGYGSSAFSSHGTSGNINGVNSQFTPHTTNIQISQVNGHNSGVSQHQSSVPNGNLFVGASPEIELNHAQIIQMGKPAAHDGSGNEHMETVGATQEREEMTGDPQTEESRNLEDGRMRLEQIPEFPENIVGEAINNHQDIIENAGSQQTNDDSNLGAGFPPNINFLKPGLFVLPGAPFLPTQTLLPTTPNVFNKPKSATDIFNHERQDAKKFLDQITKDQQKLAQQHKKWLEDTRVKSASFNKKIQADDLKIPIFKNSLNQNVDLNNFDPHPQTRRHTDDVIPEVKDGQIPVKFIEEPLQINRVPNAVPTLSNVGSPYLFDIPFNQREATNMPVDRSTRSDTDLLNLAKGITDGTLSNIFSNSGTLGDTNGNQDFNKNLGIARGITMDAFKTASNTEQTQNKSTENKEKFSDLDRAIFQLKVLRDRAEKREEASQKATIKEVEDVVGGSPYLEEYIGENIKVKRSDEFKKIISELEENEHLDKGRDDAILGIINDAYMNQNMMHGSNGMIRRETIGNPDCELHKSNNEMDATLGSILKNQQNFTDEKLDNSKKETNKSLGKLLENQKELNVPSKITEGNIDSFMKKQKDVFENLKNNQDDGDLVMIGNIGENIMRDAESSIAKSKRELGSINQHLVRRRRASDVFPLAQLFTDPQSKIDIPKSFDHFGSVTRNAFEDTTAPMFHVRNMFGSAHDTILSALRVPPKNLLPTSLSVMKNEELEMMKSPQGLVGASQGSVEAINPSLVSRMGETDSALSPAPVTNAKIEDSSFSNDFGISSAFEQVGAAIKHSINSGRETLERVNDVANNAKSIIHTVQNTSPRFEMPVNEVENKSKIMMITPRILDFSEEKVGSSAPNMPRGFLRVGEVMDAVGISNPNAEPVDMEKVIFPKTGPVILRDKASKLLKGQAITLDKLLKQQNKDLASMEKTLNNLDQTRQVVGASNLRDFMVQMKKHADTINESHQQSKLNNEEVNLNAEHENIKDSEPTAEDIKVGLLLPEALMNPFMGRATEADIKRFSEHDDSKHNQQSVLSAINGEKFKPNLSKTKTVRTRAATMPFNEPVANEGQVGTFMTMQGPMLHPFMGRPTEDNANEFFEDFNNDMDFINENSAPSESGQPEDNTPEGNNQNGEMDDYDQMNIGEF